MANANRNENKPKKPQQDRETPIRRETEQQGQDDPQPTKGPKREGDASRPAQPRVQSNDRDRQGAGVKQDRSMSPVNN